MGFRFAFRLPTGLSLSIGLTLLGVLVTACLAEQVEEAAPEPLWSYIQPNIFAGTGHCTACHTGSAAGGAGLSLDFTKYSKIQDGKLATKSLIPAEEIIEPTSKEDSFLYRKIAGSPLLLSGEGDKMPKDGPPFLSQGEIDLIGQWIDEGALP